MRASVVLPRPVVLRPALELAVVERADREALELKRSEASVHALEPGRNRGQQLVTAAQVRLVEPTRVAVARAVRELAARPHDPAVRSLEELARVPRVRHEAVLVGMDPVRMVDVRRIERHVREGLARVRRAQHGAVVRDERLIRCGAVLVVLVRTAEVHDVRVARRRVDEVVVPALAGAEVERVPGRSRRVVARQLREDRRARGDVVAAVEPAVLDGAGVSFADVHPRLAVRQARDRDVGPRRADGRVQRRLDLRPRVAAVSRAPHATRVRSRVDRVRVARVDLDVTHAARCARCRVVRDRGDVRAAVRRARGAGVDHRPRGAAVRRAVEAPLRRPRDQRPVLADAAVAAHGRVSADREGRAGVDRVRIARLDPDRPDTARVERGGAVRARPVVAAVRRLVEADARDAAAAAGVALTRADPERVPARIVRVDRDRPGRVDPEAPAQVLPVRVRGQRVVRAPDASARRRDPHAALRAVAPVGRCPVAVRVDGEVGRPTRRRVLLRNVRVRVPVRRELVQRRLRADLLPRQVRRARSAAQSPRPCRLEGGARSLQARQRDVFLRICELGELLQRSRRGAGPGRLARRLASVARNRLAEFRQMTGEGRRHVAFTRRGWPCRSATGLAIGSSKHRSHGHESDRDGGKREPQTSCVHGSPPLFLPRPDWAAAREYRKLLLFLRA